MSEREKTQTGQRNTQRTGPETGHEISDPKTTSLQDWQEFQRRTGAGNESLPKAVRNFLKGF